jgi:hypothetical protein
VATPTGQGRDGWLAGWPIDEWAHFFFFPEGNQIFTPWIDYLVRLGQLERMVLT